MRLRKLRKWSVLCGMAGMLAAVATGCQDMAQTEEEIVTPKQEQGSESEENLPGEQAGAAEEEEGSGGAIAEQVQAPEHYNWEGGSDKVSVKVDADLMIPQAEGFQSWQVTSRVFTQEDYDNVSRVLLKSAPLFTRDYEAMADSNGFTRAEVEEKIAELEARREKAGSGSKTLPDKEETYDEAIEKWTLKKEQAPEEVVILEVPATVRYTESDEYLEENEIFGTATVDGEDYTVILDNNLRKDWRWITFQIRSEEANSNFVRGGVGEETLPGQLSRDEIRAKAEEAASAMGFTDFIVGGEELYSSFSVNEEEPQQKSLEADQIGCGFSFTRTLEGIPVTYTHEGGTTLEDDNSVPWPYEYLTLIYNTEGIASFEWGNPYQVEKTSDEYVFLLPFSEIETIFKEMLVKKYEDFFEDGDGIRVSFSIDEIRLGYMRVMERGNALEGKMIPVWDFFGTETVTYPDQSEPYVSGSPYESWLTINAMDGTIIDRGLGY